MNTGQRSIVFVDLGAGRLQPQEVETGRVAGESPEVLGGVEPGQRVVVLDDLLATGGTMAAAVDLLEQAGAQVQATACIIELAFLGGRDKLQVPTHSLISYEA